MALVSTPLLAQTQAPSITVPPASRTALVGQPVTFSVTAGGSPAPTYQWNKNGAALTGATSATLAFTAVSAADAAGYTVALANSSGSVTSPAAVLAVGAVQTNPLGPQGTTFSSVFASQYLGARFTITAPTKLAAVFADFGNSSGSFFAAVVPLASLTAIPVGTTAIDVPFNAGEVLASTTFTLPAGFAGRATVPLSVDLAPGVYGVVFGSGYLGTTGTGSMLVYANTTGSNGLLRNGPTGGPYAWVNTSSSRWSVGLATVTGAGNAPDLLVPPAPLALAVGGKGTLSVVPTGTIPFAFQ